MKTIRKMTMRFTMDEYDLFVETLRKTPHTEIHMIMYHGLSNDTEVVDDPDDQPTFSILFKEQETTSE